MLGSPLSLMGLRLLQPYRPLVSVLAVTPLGLSRFRRLTTPMTLFHVEAHMGARGLLPRGCTSGNAASRAQRGLSRSRLGSSLPLLRLLLALQPATLTRNPFSLVAPILIATIPTLFRNLTV